MIVEIKALGGLVLTENLERFCRTRIVKPLERLYDREGTALVIELSDTNGPKGGIDKSCRITYTMPLRPITVREEADDIYKAVDGAARRFRRLVIRNKDWKLVRTRYPTKYFIAEQEHRMQPGTPSSPADIDPETDTLAAREARLAAEEGQEEPAGR